MDDFDFSDTAAAPLMEQEFLMENLCVKKGRSAGGYEPPPTRSAAKRWKHLNEQNMMTRLNEMHIIKKQNAQMSKEAAREIIRKIPVELLAKEWLSKEDATVDMRAYLVDHILPTLILGVERLLKEVDEKGLSATNRFEPEFNPINFLAQYLMRNNPRFSNFAEASPYVRGLREVSEEIKQELFTFEDNRLARIKAETRRKRTDRERHEQQIREGKERRHSQLILQFKHWTHYTQSSSIQLAVLQNCLRSFTETVEKLPPEIQDMARFPRPLDPIDETGKELTDKEFAQYISLFVEDLPAEVFHLFMAHLSKCATSQRALTDRENRRTILTNLFLICDYGVLGLLDRARIMTLFERFWDSIMETMEPSGTLRNPRRWPIVEVEELDDILFDAWHDESDGGITHHESRIQNKLLEAIKVALFQEAEACAARDKAAKEKWKQEQLEQKSAGYRAKLYKYNVTDFMNLVQYPLLDAMEAPVRNFDNTDARLTKDHDLYASTITKTARERYKGIYGVDSFDYVKSSDDGKLSGDRDSRLSEKIFKEPSFGEDEDIFGLDSRPSKKDVNTNSRILDSSFDGSEMASSPEPVNRNNNTLGSEDSSNKGKEHGSKSYHKGKSKMSVSQRRKLRRMVRFNRISGESSDESEATPRPQLRLRKQSPVSSEDAFPQNKIGSLPPFKNKNDVVPAGSSTQRLLSPKTLPPICAHKQNESGQRTIEIMRELVASQTKLLGSRAVGFPPAARYLGKNVTEPLRNNVSDITDDVNSNRSIVDVNTNSCFRTRRMSEATTQKEFPQLSAFHENDLDLAQFVQLIETFIGPFPDPKVFATLVHFITDGYQDTEAEKTEKLLQAKEKANLIRKKQQLNNLFEKWDNDASGFLEVDDVADVMYKFKDGQEIEAIRAAMFELKKQSEYYDGRLSKHEFRQFINLVSNELPGKETFDLIVEFLMNSVERSYAERIRGEARKKWIQQINQAARTSGTSMEPVYKAVFQALYKDAETHGKEKRISASISMLESNKLEPSRGELMLRYSACTPEDCQYMLGKPLYKNMKGVSFQAVETGKPIHVPRVSSHGMIYFWNYDRKPDERQGSFVAIPLKDNKKRVFGVLGVDTMIDPKKETIFITHEIHFFQGVAKAFSIGYHLVEKRRRFMRVLEVAFSWFHRRCPNIIDITVYFMEPGIKVPTDFVLRKMVIKDKTGAAVQIPECIRLERKEELFRKYLFDCIETSLTVIADVHEARHAACPIRDINGKAVGLIDLSFGQLKNLPHYESKEAQRLLRLLQKAYRELSRMSKGEEPDCILEVERDPTIRTDILFERLMLQELRDNISRLDSQSYVEIKGYYEPPRVIADIIQATIAVFKVDQVGEGEYDSWDDLKNCINSDLIQQIKTYDPVSSANLPVAEKVEKYLKATFSAPLGEVAEQGSIPARQLYNWVFTCLALIEYVLRTKESAEGSVLVAAGKVDHA